MNVGKHFIKHKKVEAFSFIEAGSIIYFSLKSFSCKNKNTNVNDFLKVPVGLFF